MNTITNGTAELAGTDAIEARCNGEEATTATVKKAAKKATVKAVSLVKSTDAKAVATVKEPKADKSVGVNAIGRESYAAKGVGLNAFNLFLLGKQGSFSEMALETLSKKSSEIFQAEGEAGFYQTTGKHGVFIGECTIVRMGKDVYAHKVTSSGQQVCWKAGIVGKDAFSFIGRDEVYKLASSGKAITAKRNEDSQTFTGLMVGGLENDKQTLVCATESAGLMLVHLNTGWGAYERCAKFSIVKEHTGDSRTEIVNAVLSGWEKKQVKARAKKANALTAGKTIVLTK